MSGRLQDSPYDYAELFERLKKSVATVCPGWLQDRRDDLVQQSLLRVVDLLERSEGNRELSSSYLWKVAHSALIDQIRRERRRQEVSLEDASPVDFPGSGPTSPEVRARAREIDDALQDCLAGMVPSRREAVTLRLQEHTVPEAADILGWTVKKTENLVYRGLKDLRDCLQAKGMTP